MFHYFEVGIYQYRELFSSLISFEVYELRKNPHGEDFPV